MSKRLPRPAEPVQPRCEIDRAELSAVEDMAHLCRLSVASFIRVALVEAAAHPERKAAWEKIAADIAANPPPDRRKPGRPKDTPPPTAEPPKKRGGK